jgi:hypothetical protein
VTITDGVNSPVTSFNIIVSTNSPPTFATALATQTVTIGFSKTYPLPATSDPEGAVVSVTSVVETGLTVLPSFITLAGTTLTIAPVAATPTGTTTIDVTLSDGINSPVFSFNVIVQANSPPSFATSLVS